MEAEYQYKQLAQIVRKYGGKPPKFDSDEAFRMMSDFGRAMGFRLVVDFVPITPPEARGD